MARLKTIDMWRLQVPTGTTHPNRSNFSSAEVEDTVTVLVPVKINSHNSQTYFVVDHTYGAHRYQDKDTDINALRERARAAELATCDNGGFEAWMCPHGCGPHCVSFSHPDEFEDDDAAGDAFFAACEAAGLLDPFEADE